MNTCVVRPLGSLNAYASVPRALVTTRGSSGIVRARQIVAISGSALIPNCAHWPARMRKNRASS
jgi:hypothetical protein